MQIKKGQVLIFPVPAPSLKNDSVVGASFIDHEHCKAGVGGGLGISRVDDRSCIKGSPRVHRCASHW